MNKHNNKLTQTETGMVSIIVTMIIMIVLSLIVMGFAQLSRREQRMALDRQLSTQAFYAAESGVKDAIKAYNANPLNFADKATCDHTITFTESMSILDSTANIAYTCLLINTKVKTIILEPLESGVVVPISNPDLTSLEVSWDAGGPDKSIPSTFALDYPTLPPLSSWNTNTNTNVLEVTITQLASPTRANLTSNSFTAFLYPSREGAAGSASVDSHALYTDIKNQGPLIKANCNDSNTPRKCKVNFTTLPGNDPSKGYVVRIKTVYGLLSKNYVAITGTNGAGAIEFTGSQISIDSTGKAGDVLRRIQVRYPIRQSDRNIEPLSAIESSGSLCKMIDVAPGLVKDVFTPDCPSFDYP